MANPTTNFGWQMPTPTDLVTDLPADFAVFGQAVDTSLAELKGGTTGQILSKTSNTDMDFTWITNDVGDITAVTAGTGISGGGTSGAVTVTNSMATAIDAKGDLIAGTAADAFSRLAVGTNGQVLTAASGQATGLSWTTPATGAFTLISTTALTGTSVTVSAIPQTYRNLHLVFNGYYPSTNTLYLAVMFANGGTNLQGNSYYYGTLATGTQTGAAMYSTPTVAPGWSNTLANNSKSKSVINIFDYATTTGFVTATGNTSYYDGNNVIRTSASIFTSDVAGPVERFTVSSGAGGNINGSVSLYGEK